MYLRSCYKLVGDSISHTDCYHQNLTNRIKKFQHLASKIFNIQLLASNNFIFNIWFHDTIFGVENSPSKNLGLGIFPDLKIFEAFVDRSRSHSWVILLLGVSNFFKSWLWILKPFTALGLAVLQSLRFTILYPVYLTVIILSHHPWQKVILFL